MKTQICSCRSCGHGFSAGRGLAADRFCSQRCVDWFDAGNPTHGEVRKGRDPYRVVASGDPSQIGKPPAIRSAETISAHDLADALGIPQTAVTLSGITGSKSIIRYRTTGRRWQVDLPARIAKRLGCLASDGHGAVVFRRLPTPDEAATIRRLIGLRPLQSMSLPEATDHFQKKAVNYLLSN